MEPQRPIPAWLPTAGCLSLLIVVGLLFLLPFLFVNLMHSALERLHLTSVQATLAVVGILLGGFINIPVHRIERDEPQPVVRMGPYGMLRSDWMGTRPDTLVAVNVGGCVIPTILALRQLPYVIPDGQWVVVAMLAVVAINTAVCYRFAMPVRGIGIMMPWFISPLTAVIATWLLLPGEEMEGIRASVAFVGGVSGPLIGADLLHLRDISRVSVGMLSIGGAGTFDGIVLSGLLAALLA